MMTIQLVVVDGKLTGRTFSDEWNLATLMGEMGVTSIPYHKNGAGLRKIRALYGADFTFKVDAKATSQPITDAERFAITPVKAAA